VPIVIAAVAVVGALCLLDLVLTFGVIRRLREHTTMLAENRGHGLPGPPVIGVAQGELPGTFAAVTRDGEHVDDSAALRVVAFFSTRCSICPERVPPFLEYLAARHIDRASVLAVVVGDDSEPAPYLESLAEFAQVCLEQEDGEVAKAFKVAGYPAFCLLGGDGTVLASGYDPQTLPEPALA
jgi:hypothetical protein